MVEISRDRLSQIFEKFNQLKIAVLGDLMLDRYVWGNVSRISPEAPVPVVDVEKESACLGGAANVTLNIHTLGAEVLPIGLIGNDPSGTEIKTIFQRQGFSTEGLIKDNDRPTTVKTRIIADCQHVVRSDYESRDPITHDLEKEIVDLIKKHAETLQGIILQDYNKGLLTLGLIQEVLELSKKYGIKTFVDPKYENFFAYKHATLFKPNRKETSDKLGMKLTDVQQVQKAAELLFEKLHCEALLITLGEDGMMLFEPGKPVHHAKTKAVKVHDVSGAGDTVISTLAVAASAGATLPEAVTLANHAAGIVCGEVGVVPIHKKQLFDAMLEDEQA